jgi:hypothetical protein
MTKRSKTMRNRYGMFNAKKSMHRFIENELSIKYTTYGPEITQSYYTHDNGGRPFKVEITPEMEVNVYACEYDYDDEECSYDELVLQLNDVKMIFVGKSPLNDGTAFSGGYGPRFTGSSILIELFDRYMFIGDKIYTFSPLSKIVEFCSPVGNNDVPYPYAVDEENNVYLFCENTILFGVGKINDPSYDPYPDFYEEKYLSRELLRELGIKKYFIVKNNREEESQFRYYNHTEEWFNQLGTHYIEDYDGNRRRLTFRQFKDIMKIIEDELGFTTFEVNVIHERL